MSMGLKIAMLGTRGVPARYGGFETAVEEIGKRLADQGHRVTVYCRAQDGVPAVSRYLGMDLVYLPALRRRSLETLSHTGLSVAHALHRTPDVALVFNAANAPWLPLLKLRGVPVATHVDGLEWRRAKWGPVGRRYYLGAERASVLFSDALIADAPGISRYYRDKFSARTDLISYGAPQVGRVATRLGEIGLEAKGYHLLVARFEPENHVEPIVKGYVKSHATRPLVVVGSAPYSEAYTAKVRAAADGRVKFLGGVWDQDLLDQLYAGSFTYIHGHSVGGTNPSLLRAMGAGASTLAFDVDFNRDVLLETARYWSGPEELSKLIETAESNPAEEASRGEKAMVRSLDYSWDVVAAAYETLCRRLAGRN